MTENKELALSADADVQQWGMSLVAEYGSGVEVDTKIYKVPTIKLGTSSSDDVKAKIVSEGDFYSPEFGKNFGQSVWCIPVKISMSSAMIYSKKKSRGFGETLFLKVFSL
jgi:hypothetical protein